jgi:hypothetical protein
MEQGSSERGQFCSSCGTPATAGASFCPACGHSITLAPDEAEGFDTAPTELGDPKSIEQPQKRDARQGGRAKGFVLAGLILIVPIGITAALFLVVRHSSTGSSTTRCTNPTTGLYCGSPNSPQPTASSANGDSNSSATPEQQFANDISNIPISGGGTIGGEVGNTVHDGSGTNTGETFSDTDLGGLGDQICNTFAQASSNPQWGSLQRVYTDEMTATYTPYFTELNHGVGLRFTWHPSTTDEEKIVSAAINDICPSFQSAIPYGFPGAP